MQSSSGLKGYVVWDYSIPANNPVMSHGMKDVHSMETKDVQDHAREASPSQAVPETVTEPGYSFRPATKERQTAAVRLPLIVAALSAATCGMLHAVWVLFPLLDARFTDDGHSP